MCQKNKTRGADVNDFLNPSRISIPEEILYINKCTHDIDSIVNLLHYLVEVEI